MNDATRGNSAEQLAERLMTSTIGALELFSVYLGVRLGLYETLASGEAMTVEELAASAEIDQRYAREWLEQQAVAGLLTADGGDDTTRRFALPAGHAAVLADVENPAYVAPFSQLLAGTGQVLPQLVAAYRSGAGVPYADYGTDLRDGQAAINRPAFSSELPATWLPAVPDVHARLQAAPPARIADVACGAGWSTIALARAYPLVAVDGFDLDEASIADARANLAGTDVAERVTFLAQDIAAASLAERYDLVCIFEALHDMARPVEALAAVRRMLTPGGSLLVAEERVAEEFSAPGDEVERMMYGWSVLHCLPAGRVEQPSAATGTVLRPAKLREYAMQAGFESVDVLDVDNDFFRLYHLVP